MLFYTCFITNPIRSGEKFAFSEEVREKHVGFRGIGQGKFVLLKQKSGEFFSESPYKPCKLLYSVELTGDIEEEPIDISGPQITSVMDEHVVDFVS